MSLYTSRLLLSAILLSLLHQHVITAKSVSDSAERWTPSHGKIMHQLPAGAGSARLGEEYWGYVDVRPGAHMFFWLYHTTHVLGYQHVPLLIWFQGGPGASGVGYGNFEEIGPLDLNLNERNTTWQKEASLLFIDNPVGSGYSYVDTPSDLTTNVQEITDDMITFITEFMVMFPDHKTIPLYVFGQSYGGKMGSHFSRQLYTEVQAGRVEANIVAFAMGNSWISPIDSTMTWGPLLYQMSLVDKEGHDEIQAEAQKAQDAINAGNWTLATDYWASTEWVVIDKTHGVDFYNILKFVDYWSKQIDDVAELRLGLHVHRRAAIVGRPVFLPTARAGDELYNLMNGPIRDKLEVIPENVTWDGQSDLVFEYQEGDFMKPVVSTVDDALMNTNLQVIVYQGQLDLICDVAGAMDWVQQLTWPNLPNYNNATRKWFINEETRQTEMFVKAHDKFKFYWVLDAGHSVPKDNGNTAYRMLQRILQNQDT